MIAGGNHSLIQVTLPYNVDWFRVWKSAAGKAPNYPVIARSAATWQSSGTKERNAVQKRTFSQEIATAFQASQ